MHKGLSGLFFHTLQGVLRDDNATDRLTVGMIVDLVRTKGYKTLAGDLPDLVDGADDSSTVNVQVGDLKMLHRSSSNIIEYTLTMLETS